MNAPVRQCLCILFTMAIGIGSIQPAKAQDAGKSAARVPGVDWVRIPGGSFTMGSRNGKKWEKPEHKVTLSSFDMARTEVTVSSYRACVVEGACTLPIQRDSFGTECHWGQRDRHRMPINCVNWTQANDFCRWVGGRLPTEAQWEYAARSGANSTRFPWGSEKASCKHVVMKTSGGATGCDALSYGRKTWPVCSKPAGNNAFGVCDLAGNVFEWTADRFDGSYYRRSPPTEPPGPASDATPVGKRFYVVRGGSYVDREANLEAFRRFRDPASNQKANVGFRCVR